MGERRDLEDGERTALSVTKFFPDFVLGAGNEPQTRSNEPNNPAALIEGYRGEKFFSGWVFANYPDFSQTHGTADSGLTFELKRFDAEPVSVIELVYDPGAILIWIGCALVMAGLGLAFYWPTWEIRVSSRKPRARPTSSRPAPRRKAATASRPSSPGSAPP